MRKISHCEVADKTKYSGHVWGDSGEAQRRKWEMRTGVELRKQDWDKGVPLGRWVSCPRGRAPVRGGGREHTGGWQPTRGDGKGWLSWVGPGTGPRNECCRRHQRKARCKEGWWAGRRLKSAHWTWPLGDCWWTQQKQSAALSEVSATWSWEVKRPGVSGKRQARRNSCKKLGELELELTLGPEWVLSLPWGSGAAGDGGGEGWGYDTAAGGMSSGQRVLPLWRVTSLKLNHMASLQWVTPAPLGEGRIRKRVNSCSKHAHRCRGPSVGSSSEVPLQREADYVHLLLRRGKEGWEKGEEWIKEEAERNFSPWQSCLPWLKLGEFGFLSTHFLSHQAASRLPAALCVL